MPLRNSTPYLFSPVGLSDALDGTNSFPGAMSSLQNLIPDPSTTNMFTPRPASVSLTTFGGFSAPAQGSYLFVIGNIAYGMIASSRNAGKDEPFAYDLSNNVFQTVSGITNANTPTSQPTTGDWTPPRGDLVGGKIIVTHPGFAGGASPFFGWFDISGFSDATRTGNTHTSTLVDSLSTNVLLAGWTVGMTITGPGFNAGTTIATIASNGLSLTLNQATTSSVNGAALTVAGGTAGAPLWAAGNVNGNPLVAVPVDVKNFSGRAYFAVNNALAFTDSLNGVQATNANQILTLGGNNKITAVGALELQSATQGGIVQSLIAFKGTDEMWQITGDSSTNNLVPNKLNVATGTKAPNSIVSTNAGLAFVSPDGVRICDFSATVSDPIGEYGMGVAAPFINAANPTRITAGCTHSVIRITVQDNTLGMATPSEYWFDLTKKIWTGPHSFPATLIAPWGATFVMFPTAVTGALFKSDSVPSLTSSYVENGNQMQVTYQTCLMPDNQQMAENVVVESTIAASLPIQTLLTISAQAEDSSLIDQVMINTDGMSTKWDSFNWGGAVWAGQSAYVVQRPINWHQPIVFKQMRVMAQANAAYGLRLGNINMRYQQLGYLTQQVANA